MRSAKSILPNWCALEATVTTRTAAFSVPSSSTAVSRSSGSSLHVRAACPRWLTPSWYSKPSAVSSRVGSAMTPALLRRTLRGFPESRTAALKSLTD